MDIPSTPSPGAGRPALNDRAVHGCFVCTGFLLADVWFPRGVVMEIGRRLGIADQTITAAAVQQLLARGWFRASPNDRWLKLMPSDELRALWEGQPEATRAPARQLLQAVLLWQANELQQTADDETLGLVLRQLVHLARIGVAAQDPDVAALLLGLAAGFERLGMEAEARTAYRDAAALLKQRDVQQNAQ